MPEPTRPTHAATPRPIAIIGIATRFPGAATKREFWSNQRANRCCITEVPPERWRWQDVFGDPLREPAKTSSKWGGFLADLDRFDPRSFGISPFEAELMDPQQRLFIKACWEAIGDAGYPASHFASTDLGVFVGVQFQEYQQLLRAAGIVKAQVSTGNARTMLPNRVSFLLDAHGPSEAIDTSCSSSLVALHHAVRALREGSCHAALVGGSNLILVPDVHIMGSQLGILSPTGRPRVLDANADGYVRSEGVGALLLKPLDAAIADGDYVYATILGSAVGHGGRAHTLTAPLASAQARVMTEAMRDAGIDFGTVSYVELHATGTVVGDPVEVEAVVRAFGGSEPGGLEAHRPYSCMLGSVKANLGHLEAASGLAGVTNVAMALDDRWLPGMSGFERLNPAIDLDGTPLCVSHDGGPWLLPAHVPTRRAIVNSFGFGGTCCSVVLEQAPAPSAPPLPHDGEVSVLLSVRDPAHLRPYAQALRREVQALAGGPHHGPHLLERIASTLQVGREALPVRAAIRASELVPLVHALRSLEDGGLPPPSVAVATSAEAAAAHRWPEPLCRWLAGADVRWPDLLPSGPRRVPLPVPPWSDQRCWFAPRDEGRADPISAPPTPTPGFVYLRPTWVRDPGVGDSSGPAPGSRALILGEDIGPLHDLRQRLHGSCPGLEVVTSRLTPWPAAANTGEVDLVVPATERGIEAWIERVFAAGPRPSVVFVVPEATADPEHLVRTTYLVTRQLMARSSSRPTTMVYVAAHPEGSCPHEGALEALAKSAHLENERFIINVVYPPHPRGEGWSGYVVDEWRRAPEPTPRMVRFHDGQREVRRLERHDVLPSPATPGPRGFVEGGTYLVPGGAGELGRRLATSIAARYRANVILVGRSAPDGTHPPLRGANPAASPPDSPGRILYDRCDITSLDDVESTVAATIARFGRLHGIVSLVTDHRDAFIFNKDWNDFQAVSAAKVQGTINLDLATRDLDLDLFVAFASQASLGMAGACDYAYACEFQNRFTAWRNERAAAGERRGHATTINWSRWIWDRYVTEDFDAWVRALGYRFLDLETGFAELEHILGARAEIVFSLHGDRERIMSTIDLRAGLLDREASAQRGRTKAAPPPPPSEIEAMLGTLSHEELSRLAHTLLPDTAVSTALPAPAPAPSSPAAPSVFDPSDPDHADPDRLAAVTLRRVLSRLMKIDEPDDDASLPDLGIDSIIAVSITTELEDHLGISMHPNWLFEYPVVGELVDKLANAVRASSLSASSPTAAAP